MKSMGKFMSACAVIVITTVCYGITETTEEVTVYNRTGGTLYGGIYLASGTGKVVSESSKDIKKVNDFGLIKQDLSKPSKRTNSYRLIFSTDEQSMKDKVAGKNPKNIVSKKIDPFSANAPMSYTIRRKNSKKEFKDIAGAKDLTID